MAGRSQCLKGKALRTHQNVFSIFNTLSDLITYLSLYVCYSRNNVGYASTCNSVGQTAGYFLGYVLFMALESPEFCNGYLRSVPSDRGVITLPGKSDLFHLNTIR